MTAPLAIGVDVGGTKLAAGLVGADGALLAAHRWPERVRDYDAALDAIAALVARLREQAAAGGDDVVAVGVAAAAFLDADRTHVRHAANLDWHDRGLLADLAARVALPVTLVNDADAAAWGEHVHGAAAGDASVVLITLGTGVGSGIVVDRRLVTGAHGLGGEIGHLPVVPGGRACPCGGRGCLEQYASGPALRRAAIERATADPCAARRLLEAAGGTLEAIDGPAVLAAARDGDPAARAAFGEVGRWAGIAAAHAVALLDPGVVLLGGGLADAGELILAPAQAAYEQHVGIPALHADRRLGLARLGAHAGTIGAAALARAQSRDG